MGKEGWRVVAPGGDLGSLLLQKAICSLTLRGFEVDFLVKSDLSKFNVKPSS